MMIGAVVRRLMEHHPEGPVLHRPRLDYDRGRVWRACGACIEGRIRTRRAASGAEANRRPMMARKKKPKSEPLEPLVPRLGFGKFKGRTVEEVMRVESDLPRLVRRPGGRLRGDQGGDQDASEVPACLGVLREVAGREDRRSSGRRGISPSRPSTTSATSCSASLRRSPGWRSSRGFTTASTSRVERTCTARRRERNGTCSACMTKCLPMASTSPGSSRPGPTCRMCRWTSWKRWTRRCTTAAKAMTTHRGRRSSPAQGSTSRGRWRNGACRRDAC